MGQVNPIEGTLFVYATVEAKVQVGLTKLCTLHLTADHKAAACPC